MMRTNVSYHYLYLAICTIDSIHCCLVYSLNWNNTITAFQTDIGDPLVHSDRLIGYYLGGDVCNRLNKLEVYSNIAPLRKWILENIKRNSNKDENELIDDDEYFKANDNSDVEWIFNFRINDDVRLNV